MITFTTVHIFGYGGILESWGQTFQPANFVQIIKMVIPNQFHSSTTYTKPTGLPFSQSFGKFVIFNQYTSSVADLPYGAPSFGIQKYFLRVFQTAMIICLHSEVAVTH